MDHQEINSTSGENVSLSKEKETFIPGGRAVGAGASIEWISNAWNMFKAQPLKWLLLYLTYSVSLLAFVVVSSILALIIPYLFFAIILILPVFTAGIIVASEEQRMTGELKIGSLFVGFKHKLGSLVAVGALTFGISILGLFASMLIGGVSLLQLFFLLQNSDPALLLGGISTLILAGVIMAIFSIIALAFSWFAPALIMINDLKFGEAVSMSLSAVKQNLLGGFIFFLLINVLMYISAIPFGLGLLITIPMYMATYYTTYRNIFYAPQVSKSE
ncbi:conserved membrane protein of unknown function [Xenorhabdus poinarii G6]|uniref:Transmembrane protein n=1 Tax=Xenorhabdus poinarii G6 TaxID=1354304 RepID=A0A068R4B4_9GAMM|nr:BPSS1780 family membrane protein [Xenorhabdus poinarii]CDG21869.1 conserved membrane protein of unknown function [Xenorhabdus poinarii G6]